MIDHHDDFEQLTAGYALRALEPADELRLTTHVQACSGCALLIAEAEDVAAALAGSVDQSFPPPALRERILSRAAAQPGVIRSELPQDPWLSRPPQSDMPTPSSSTLSRGRAARRTGHDRSRAKGRLLAGALAIMVGVAIAIPATLAASRTGLPAASGNALEQRLLERGSRELTLTGAAGTTRAKAVLTPTGGLVIADGLPTNDTRRTTYVLWAANTSGARIALSTFDVTSGKPVQIAMGRLPFTVKDISQILISYEPGREAPQTPSDVVLSGNSD